MSDLVVAVTEALQESIDVPYVVFGHSVGALAAFEWTRRLRRLGCPGPEHLLVAARRAPHIAERRAPISHFPQAKFVAAICQRYNGIPAEVLKDQELLDLLVPTLRADVQLLESYTYRDEPPLACPITSFGGQEDTEVSALDLGGWQQHTDRRCNVRMFPGSHFFLQSAEPAVTAAVADIVADVLGKPARFGGGA